MRRKFIIREIQRHFDCQRCQRCCQTPGFVFLTGKDIEKLAVFFRMAREEFEHQYCRQHDGQWVLNVNPDESCIFLTKDGCSVHEAKPKQCRDFPMKWRDEECFDYCEGIKKITSLQNSKSLEVSG